MLFTALLALCDLLTLPFYSIQAHLPEDNSINLGLSPPPWIINKENASQTGPRGQSEEDIFSVGVPSSQVVLRFVTS